MAKKKELVLILDNIRSLHNVGAIFRLADGFGVSFIYLCGITATPPRAEIHKTALGAETRVMWKYTAEIKDQVSQLKKQGFAVAALEITPTAIPIQEYKPTFPLALIVGHETEGVGEDVLQQSDIHVHIPMTGGVKSLNVSTATAIATWQLLQV